MKEYSNYTLTDLKVMTNKEFEKYVKQEYKIYIDELRHEDDYMTYNEFYLETKAMIGRQDKDNIFNY
jgi:aminopeptidase-like protein